MTSSDLNLGVEKYEIKMSKSGEKVPVVNDVHLHSVYDPRKEASDLVKRHIKNWNNKRDVLVFGLGFGYHIQALIEEFEQRPMSYKIVIIEPNEQTSSDCSKLNNFDSKKVYIHTGARAHQIYNDRELIDFLLRKPAMFTHPPSFNLYSDYFKSILSYSAKNDLYSITQHFQSKELKEYFARIENQSQTFRDYTSSLDKNGHQVSELDFLIMAYRSMVEKSIEINEANK